MQTVQVTKAYFVSLWGIMVLRNSLTVSELWRLQGVFERYLSVCKAQDARAVKQQKIIGRGEKAVEKSRSTHLVHDGVEVLLPGTVFVLHTVLPLLLEVRQQLEHLSVTAADIGFSARITHGRIRG